MKILYKIWTEEKFPDLWRQTTMAPIPKPKKDSSDPQNYRPISLNSCLCKTMERIINYRLTWYLESNNLISNLQCRFRSKRGTIDHLIRLESNIREVFIKKRTPHSYILQPGKSLLYDMEILSNERFTWTSYKGQITIVYWGILI